MRKCCVWLAFAFAGDAGAQISATVDIATANPTPLNPHFSGFNDEVVYPAEYFDYRPANIAAQLSPARTLYVSLYGTGIRGAAAVPCFVAGQSVAGQSVPVLYAGPVATSPGLDQINISIPKILAAAGDVEVYVVADGVASNAAGLTLQ